MGGFGRRKLITATEYHTIKQRAALESGASSPLLVRVRPTTRGSGKGNTGSRTNRGCARRFHALNSGSLSHPLSWWRFSESFRLNVLLQNRHVCACCRCVLS